MNKDPKGFTAVEGLLILVIVGLVSFAGWYVWKATNNAHNNLDSANSVNSSAIPAITAIKTFGDCVKSKTSTTYKTVSPQLCTARNNKKFTDPAPTNSWKKYDIQIAK